MRLLPVAALLLLLIACAVDSGVEQPPSTAGGGDSEPASPGDSVPADSADPRDTARGDSDRGGAPCEPLIVAAEVGANPFSAPGAVLTLTTCAPSVAVVEFWRDGGPVHRSRLSPQRLTHRVEAIGMRAETAYSLRPLVTGADGEDPTGVRASGSPACGRRPPPCAPRPRTTPGAAR